MPNDTEKHLRNANDESLKKPTFLDGIKAKFQRRREFKKQTDMLNKSRERSLKYLLREDKERKEKGENIPSTSFISLRHVNKVYPNLVQAVYDFNLDIKEKEFVVFVGPSGCGKSTTLRMIAGLEDITTGSLYLSGKLSNGIPAKDRNMAMVFQSYALYPHLNVYQNMAFSLRLRHEKPEVIYARVKEAAKILELGEYLDRKPKELSGGQRQRVALGRAIVRNASIFLMDEPLSNLDAKLRVQMRSEIVRIHRTVGATTIYVTHDQTEAMTMADRIVVMKLGHIQQIGTPQEIFDHPANMFVASFIGSPAMNLVPCRLVGGAFLFSDGKKLPASLSQKESISSFYEKRQKELKERLEAETMRVEADIAEIEASKHNKKLDLSYMNRDKEAIESDIAALETFLKETPLKLVYGIRPEDFRRATKDDSSVIDVEVKTAELMGREYIIHFDFGGKEAVARIDAKEEVKAGEHIKIELELEKARLYDPVSELGIDQK